MSRPHRSCVGYIMMAYPRLDDAFITNEIYLLESVGVNLHIFSVKRPESTRRHASVQRIKATTTYLPKVASRNEPFAIWSHLRKFSRSHLRLLRLRPRPYLTTLLFALGLRLKHRSRFPFRPPATQEQFFLDFLRAGYIALNVLESTRIRHLHGHFCHASTTITMMVSRLTDIPFSFTAHAKDIYVRKLNPGDLLQRKMRAAAFVVTCTEANRAHLQQLCPDVTSLHKIYHGVDLTMFTPTPRERRDSAKIPRVLAVGSLVEKKGFAYLVRACRLLRDQGYVFTCDIVGRPDTETERLRQLIGALELGETVFLRGVMTHEELKDVYDQSTLFCLPCIVADNADRDGIPNVLVEAMAMELPVVSTNVSGIPELIEDGANGLLVPEKDAPALAKALERLLDDSALRTTLAKAAHEKVRASLDARGTTVMLKDLFSASLTEEQRKSLDG